jgi:hypothetical protein
VKRHLTSTLLLMALSLSATAQIQDEEPQLAEFQPQARPEQQSNSDAVTALNRDFSAMHAFDIPDRGLAYEEFAWKRLADTQRSQPEAESCAICMPILSHALGPRVVSRLHRRYFPSLDDVHIERQK